MQQTVHRRVNKSSTDPKDENLVQQSGSCSDSCKAMLLWFADHPSCCEIYTSRRNDAMGESTHVNGRQISGKRLRNRQYCEMGVSKTGK